MYEERIFVVKYPVSTFIQEAKMLHALVAGKSELKIAATGDGFAARGLETEVDGHGGAKSYINEQPEGYQEIFQGAWNRLHYISMIHHRDYEYDYFVGIESGIVQFGNLWMDVAVVLIMDRAGTIKEAVSAGVIFPMVYVSEARKLGFDTMTVGKVIAKHLGGKDTDPHLTLTGVSRRKILAQAVEIALGQFC